MTDLIARGSSPTPVRALARWMWPAVVAVAPWSWFALMHLGARVDIVAVLLPALGLVGFGVCAVAAIARPRPPYWLSAASIALFTAVAVLAPRIPDGSGEPVRPFLLVAANALDGNRTPGAAARALLARDADVLVVVETPRSVRRSLAPSMRKAGFDHEVGGRIDVFSRWPLRGLEPLEGIPTSVAFRVTVERPDGPFALVPVHMPNPLHEISFSRHLAMLQRLLNDLDGATSPVVVAGDLNTSDRTQTYQVLTSSMRDAMRSGWAGRTYVRGMFNLLDLRIDHVLEPEAWCSAGALTFTVPGSDHRGLSVRLGACPPGPGP